MPVLRLGPDDGLFYEYLEPAAGRPTIVFVNALTGNTGAWEAVVAPTCRADGLGTLSYNFRGQTDSPFSEGLDLDADLIVADMKRLLTEVAPPQPILCGLSIGGLFAARAVLEGAEVAGLVLLNTLREMGPRLEWVNSAMLQAVTIGGFPLLMDMFLPLLTNEDYQAANRSNFLASAAYAPQDTAHGHYKLMSAGGGTDWVIAYERLALPVLTITGLQDRVFFNRPVVERLRTRLPDATHIEWDNAGHLLPQEQPEELAAALIEFAVSRVVGEQDRSSA